MRTPSLLTSAVVGMVALVALGVYLQPAKPVPAALPGCSRRGAAGRTHRRPGADRGPDARPAEADHGPVPDVRPECPRPAAPAGPTGGKCADYASQAQAQAALRRDPVSAGRLDDDRDGIACESNPAPTDKAPVVRPARP